MPKALLDFAGDIPDFAELEFTAEGKGSLLSLAEEVSENVSSHQDAHTTAQSLVAFQKELLQQQSISAYLVLNKYLDSSEAILSPLSKQDLLPRDIDINQAKGMVYKAIATYPYEDMSASAEDLDLWSRSWRWKQFESPVDSKLFLVEKRLIHRLRSLCPPLNYFKAQAPHLNVAWDSSRAIDARRELLFHFVTHLKQDAEKREKSAIALLVVRREIAKQAGFSKFSDYHEARRGKRSFARGEERQFIRQFKEVFDPVYLGIQELREQHWGRALRRFEDIFLISPQGQVPLQESPEEAALILREVIGEILGEEHFLALLMDKHYLSLQSDLRQKWEESSCNLPSIPASYLMLSLDDKYSSMPQVFLDCGKALADISTMLNYSSLGASNQDAFSKNLSAYSFLFLGVPYLAKFYEGNAETANDYAWTLEAIKALVDLAAYCFEDTLYSMEDSYSSSRIIEVFRSCLAEYIPQSDISEAEEELLYLLWPYFFSKYTNAYSSLAQIMAMMSILAEQPQRRSSNLLFAKLNAYLLTNPGSAIEERLDLAEIHSPLSLQTMNKAAFALADILGL